MDFMHPSTAQKLVELNRDFYREFGGAFAATRRRLQPGALRALGSLPLAGRWLDLGCGSGEVPRHLARMGFTGSYLGLDFSAELLAEARNGWEVPGIQFIPGYEQADLTTAGWSEKLQGEGYDVILCLAVLHHLPGEDTRLDLLRQARRLLVAGGHFIHSEWQFQHSPKLMARRQAWGAVALTNADVDEGDALLDWRYTLPGQTGRTGLRYVHLFSRPELDHLAELSGFAIEETFESDGQGGRLALYQRWRAL
jgi:2-polyprenyl-3-methyl-5-hydroxy-6-metoxy-1,4-benzoquinol methylase